MPENIRRLLYKIAPFIQGEHVSDAKYIENDNTAQSGVLSGAENTQQTLDRLDATGIGSPLGTIDGSFSARASNLSDWFNNTQSYRLEVTGANNANRTVTMPTIDALNAVFDVLEAKNVAQVFTWTVGYIGGSSTFVSRNSLQFRPASVGPIFDRNILPVTIPQGSAVTWRFSRVGGNVQAIERLTIGESPSTIDTFGDWEFQPQLWNNADSSFLPSSPQQGYVYRVFGSNPNDGTLRQGLLDGGVSDRVIYDGDYVVFSANSFTSWLNGDDWFVLDANSLNRMTRNQENFLRQVSETDTRNILGLAESQGATDALVWLSPVVMAAPPFLNSNTDSNNPRANAGGVRYLGGRSANRDSQGYFQYGANFFNSYLYLGITPNYVTQMGIENLYLQMLFDDGMEIRISIQDNFTQLDDAQFSNSTVNHYIYNTTNDPNTATTFNYASLMRLGIVLTSVQESFTLSSNVDTTPNVNNIQKSQLSREVQDLLGKITEAIAPVNPDFSSIIPRISKLISVNETTPYTNTYFDQSTGTDNFPNTVGELTRVNPENPRFQVTGTNIFIFVKGGDLYSLKNITQSTSFPLDNQIPNVDLGVSFQIEGSSFFGYRVSGLTANDVLEVESVTVRVVADWQNRLDLNEAAISKIQAELNHAALNLPDSVVHFLESEITISEENTPSRVPTDYNTGLGDTSAQTVFYEPNPNTPSGGSLASKPFSDLSGDQVRRKLLYIPQGVTYGNAVLVHAFDGSTATDLISYLNGAFNAKVLVPAVPAGSTTVTNYPAPSTRVSGAGIWINVPALTFVNGFPVPEADEVFFTRNNPTSSTTLTIQYRGHANGNVFGTASTTLAGVGGGSDVATTFDLNDGSELATVEVRWYAGARNIRVSVTEHVNTGLPTINDIEVILSYTETRTVPAIPETIRDVELETVVIDEAQVFAFKPSATNTLIIVGAEREIDTGYLYTDLFAAGETGHLAVFQETSTFLNYEDFDPITTTVIDLQNHSTLPQFGLFRTEYTHQTTAEIGTQLQVKNSFGDDVKVGDQAVVKSADGTKRFRLTVQNDGSAIIITELT